jgi:hypothetical protein
MTFFDLYSMIEKANTKRILISVIVLRIRYFLYLLDC